MQFHKLCMQTNRAVFATQCGIKKIIWFDISHDPSATAEILFRYRRTFCSFLD